MANMLTTPTDAASVGVHQPTIMMRTENTMMATIGITSNTNRRNFSRSGMRSTL